MCCLSTVCLYILHFSIEPPVPNIKTVTINAKGFYNQEFEPQKQDHPKKMPLPSSMDSPSPDLFYSSSPEPDDFIQSKLTGSQDNRRKWHDLDPDSEDEEGGGGPMTNGNNDHSSNSGSSGIKVEVKEEKGPPKISERPKSPVADLVVPIPIRPKPSQIITMNSVKELDKENQMEEEEDPVAMARSKSALPVKSSNR